MGLTGSCSPFINLVLHDDFLTIFYTTTEGRFPVEFCASLRLLLFYICFRSLLINMRLVFISYVVSDPLRKSHRGLEYQCSFVRLCLFRFAFLIICIETFCIFDYLYWDFWFFVDCFVTLPPSFAKTDPQPGIQVSGISEEQQRKKGIYKSWSTQVSLNIRPNCNYLHKMIEASG